jgi:DNA-binding CsgD family transcriptional regulator
MLRSDYLSVLETKSAGELLERIVRFGGELGFERVGAAAIVDRPGEDLAFASLDNMPVGYLERADSPERWSADPVAQHCRHSGIPIVWSQGTYVERGLGEQWEDQKPFGYGHGVALALHLPKGRHFLFGVNREEALPESPEELTRIVADVQLFAVHAQEAAARLLLPALAEAFPPPLTPRELECLRWTMEGKTAWEVGVLLGISERTAVLHVNNATHKLDCTSKHQAVIKAMRLGLIQ